MWRRFQPGEGPSRGLLHDCTTSPMDRFTALITFRLKDYPYPSSATPRRTGRQTDNPRPKTSRQSRWCRPSPPSQATSMPAQTTSFSLECRWHANMTSCDRRRSPWTDFQRVSNINKSSGNEVLKTVLHTTLLLRKTTSNLNYSTFIIFIQGIFYSLMRHSKQAIWFK